MHLAHAHKPVYRDAIDDQGFRMVERRTGIFSHFGHHALRLLPGEGDVFASGDPDHGRLTLGGPVVADYPGFHGDLFAMQTVDLFKRLAIGDQLDPLQFADCLWQESAEVLLFRGLGPAG